MYLWAHIFFIIQYLFFLSNFATKKLDFKKMYTVAYYVYYKQTFIQF